MIINTQLQMDFGKNVPGHVCAKQGDTNTRRVTLQLYDNGLPWTIPETAAPVIRYHCLPGGSSGAYDTLADGSPAWKIADNAISVMLVPQILAEAGTALMDIALIDGDALLATYNIHIHVEASPREGTALEQSDYFNLAKVSAAYDGLHRVIGQASDAIAATAEATLAAVPDALDAWLEAHPEAIASVADGSVTPKKTSFILYDERQTADIMVPNFVSQIPISTDADGSQLGTVKDVCLSALVDGLEVRTGFDTTGYIPLTGTGDILRFQGLNFFGHLCCRIAFYQPDKTFIGTVSGLTIPTDAAFNGRFTRDGDGNFTYLDLTAKESNYASGSGGAVGYMRITAQSIGPGAVVTVNEEITYTKLPGPIEQVNLRLDEDVAVPRAEENSAAIAALEERVAALEKLAGM